jgi:hypothetical protein
MRSTLVRITMFGAGLSLVNCSPPEDTSNTTSIVARPSMPDRSQLRPQGGGPGPIKLDSIQIKCTDQTTYRDCTVRGDGMGNYTAMCTSPTSGDTVVCRSPGDWSFYPGVVSVVITWTGSRQPIAGSPIDCFEFKDPMSMMDYRFCSDRFHTFAALP